MRIKQILGSEFLAKETRRTVERASYCNARNARYVLQQALPNHKVFTEGDRLVVSNKDRSIRVAEFKMIPDLPEWASF
jgi:hypothetical protein